MAENKKIPEKLVNKDMTPLYIDDKEVIELIHAYVEQKNADTFSDMLNKLATVEIIVPSTVSEDQKVHPLFIKDSKQDKTWLACYTTFRRIPTSENAPKSDALTKLPFMDAVNTVEKADCDGILINAYEDNLFISKELCKKMQEVEAGKKKKAEIEEEIKNAKGEGDILIRRVNADGKTEMVRMNDEQYDIHMRWMVEFELIPRKINTDGAAFVEDLSERREEAIDAFYEDAYELKRYYPYVLDDFSVMPLEINEDLTIVRIDMPERKMAVPSCLRVYIVWNKKENTGRYFTVEITAKKDVLIMAEITPDVESNRWKHIILNHNVTEGTELQDIVALVK